MERTVGTGVGFVDGRGVGAFEGEAEGGDQSGARCSKNLISKTEIPKEVKLAASSEGVKWTDEDKSWL